MAEDEERVIHLLDGLVEHERTTVLELRNDAAADLLEIIDLVRADLHYFQRD